MKNPMRKFLKACLTIFSKHPYSCLQISVLAKNCYGSMCETCLRIERFLALIILSLYSATGEFFFLVSTSHASSKFLIFLELKEAVIWASCWVTSYLISCSDLC